MTRYSMLTCTVAVLTFALGGIAQAAPEGSPQTVLVWHGHRLFEDFSARSEVSPDGRYVLRTFVDGTQALLRLPDGSSDDRTLIGDLTTLEKAAWCGTELLRAGSKGQERHWFASTGALPTIPPEATPVCSADGKTLAHFSYSVGRESPPKAIFLGSRQKQSEIKLDGVVMSAHFAPDGRTLYAMVRQDDGASALLAISAANHEVKQLAKDLDAWPFQGPELTVTADGSAVILPLATLAHPINAERQIPVVPKRWLKLYRFDLTTHQFKLLRSVDTSDQSDPAVVGSSLYWVSGHTTKRVLALPAAGGAMHAVVPGTEQSLPSWAPDGKRVAYIIGDYRLADWALSQDIDVVTVDDQARAVEAAKHFIVGNHEDFPPDWSRDGRWIAWHSHRASHDPAYYDDPASSDDIWIRSAEDIHAKEIRATHDLWETGWAYWSPNGRQLLYTSWDRNGTPGIYQVRISDFDPDKGVVRAEHRFPMPAQVHSPQIAIWSPTGKEIAVEDAVSPGNRTLWIVSSDGSHLTKVIDYRSETYGGLDWSPDGSTLIYAGLDGGRMQIFSVPRAGGVPRRLSDGQGNYLTPRISPDGRWIVCSQIETDEILRKVALLP